MSWYRTGTIDVTNGSTTVAGTGTAFIANVNAGDALQAPDGNIYEITGIVSDTSLSITPAYLGATQTVQTYGIQPTRGVIAELLSAVQSNNTDVTAMLGGPGAGKFPDGTLAQPGVRFTADEDTGLRRATSNDVALVAGGADKLRVSGNTASGDAVQSSDTDTTVGKLLKMGAFGLGNIGTAPEIPDLNAFDTATGFYYYAATTVNVASIPAAASITGTIIVTRAFTTTCTQILTENVALGIGGDTWYRTYNSSFGAWSGWRLLYTPENILGTVSQSSGVPTGAVIERGSNANGDYVRFADGTQICLNGNFATLASATATWTFPATFNVATSAPGIVAAPRYNDSPRIIGVRIDGAGSVSCSVNSWDDVGSDSVSPLVSIMAIGRWF